MEGKKSLNMGGKRRKHAIGSQGYQDFEGFSSGISLSLIEALAELEIYCFENLLLSVVGWKG